MSRFLISLTMLLIYSSGVFAGPLAVLNSDLFCTARLGDVSGNYLNSKEVVEVNVSAPDANFDRTLDVKFKENNIANPRRSQSMRFSPTSKKTYEGLFYQYESELGTVDFFLTTVTSWTPSGQKFYANISGGIFNDFRDGIALECSVNKNENR